MATHGKTIVQGTAETLQAAADPIRVAAAAAAATTAPTNDPQNLADNNNNPTVPAPASRIQSGGALPQRAGMGPVVAGALAALLLAGAGKGLHDYIRRQV
jgi:hypothetical protein